MDEIRTDLYLKNKELFDLTEEIENTAKDILVDFNKLDLKLFSIPPHKRILLFFLTRALKTYSAICVLCRAGYGQDVSTLLRSLLENLISIKYIVKDPKQADSLSARFVGYKWAIFRRHLAEEEKALKRGDSKESLNDFYDKKSLILKSLDDFKKKYKIISDRALLTWSGRALKDMARAVDEKLLKEYESTFRLCSRFSHPSIVSDKEYMIADENCIILSTLPSSIGVITSLKSASLYILEFLDVFDKLFNLKTDIKIILLKEKYEKIENKDVYSEQLSSDSDPSKSTINRESKVIFRQK